MFPLLIRGAKRGIGLAKDLRDSGRFFNDDGGEIAW